MSISIAASITARIFDVFIATPLFGFSVKSVLTAEFAILLQLKSVGRILLVLFCVVVSLLALGACESNLDSGIISHIVGTSYDSLFDRFWRDRCTSLRGLGWVVV